MDAFRLRIDTAEQRIGDALVDLIGRLGGSYLDGHGELTPEGAIAEEILGIVRSLQDAEPPSE